MNEVLQLTMSKTEETTEEDERLLAEQEPEYEDYFDIVEVEQGEII